MPPELPSELAINPRVKLTEMGKGVLALLHLDSSFYLTLPPAGAALFRAVKRKEATDVEALARTLVRELKVDLATARREVAALVEKMLEEGFLVRKKTRP